MSPATALRKDFTAAPASLDHGSDSRLQLLPRPAARLARTSFIAALATVMGLGFLGVLILNTSLQQGAYQLRDLERMTSVLADRRAVLTQRLAVLEAPSRLAGEARLLGMVPNENPVFLRISDGAVLGSPEPAPTPAAPAVSAIGSDEQMLLDRLQSSALRLAAAQRGDQPPTGPAEKAAKAEKAEKKDERAGTAHGERSGAAGGGPVSNGRPAGAETTAGEQAGTSRHEKPRTSRGER